jgi:hypothetical protein
MCEHKRTLHVGAKASDMQNYSVPSLDLEHQGYAPMILGLCGDDYIDFEVCLDCGVILGLEQLTDEVLIERFEEENQ